MQPDNTAKAPFVTEFTFSHIRNVRESAWLGHGPFALWLVEAMRPRTVVELGTHNGFSFFAFCQAMRDLELEGQVHAVDTWAGDPHAGFYGNEVFDAVEETLTSQFPHVGQMHRMTFDEARGHFARQSVDILHIDGLHTFEAMRHDFETWRDTVREGGVILFHDTQVRRDDFSVWKLWEELAGQYPSFEFHHAHGLGVLGIGKSFPEGLAQLFALSDDPDRAERVRAQFERLGQEPILQLELSKFASEASTLRREYKRILNTKSWRITAPLRSAQHLIANVLSTRTGRE